MMDCGAGFKQPSCFFRRSLPRNLGCPCKTYEVRSVAPAIF